MSVNSKQIVQRALAGLETPRPAVGPLAVHYCAGLAGVSVRRYTTDPTVMADCVVRYYETFRPDAVWVSADTWVSAEAMGAPVDFPDDNQPMCGVSAAAMGEACEHFLYDKGYGPTNLTLKHYLASVFGRGREDAGGPGAPRHEPTLIPVGDEMGTVPLEREEPTRIAGPLTRVASPVVTPRPEKGPKKKRRPRS